MNTPLTIAIRPHHHRLIERYAEECRAENGVLALFVGGSVAREQARDNSDVDFLLVVTDENLAARSPDQKAVFVRREVADYEGGYADVKVWTRPRLRLADERGSEPTRHSFLNAFPVFCDEPEILKLAQRIPSYPEEERSNKITSYLAQLLLNRAYFWPLAEASQDPYLTVRVASDLALFGGRLMLAHNRRFFPSHRRLMEAVEAAPEKPDGFLNMMRDLLRAPSSETVSRFCDAVESFAPWPATGDLLTRFVEDSELAWITGKPSIADV